MIQVVSIAWMDVILAWMVVLERSNLVVGCMKDNWSTDLQKEMRTGEELDL